MRTSDPNWNKPIPFPDTSISEADYLAYLLDECELNDWCKGAFPGMLAWLKAGSLRHLSEKQRQSVARAAKEFDLADDIKKGFLYKGWSDEHNIAKRVGSVQNSASTKMQQAGDDSGNPPYAKPRYGFANPDMDDDIPF